MDLASAVRSALTTPTREVPDAARAAFLKGHAKHRGSQPVGRDEQRSLVPSSSSRAQFLENVAKQHHAGDRRRRVAFSFKELSHAVAMSNLSGTWVLNQSGIFYRAGIENLLVLK